MHTEKLKIFDSYAESKGYQNWEDLYFDDSIDVDNLFKHIFAACDLVQKEQQKRIAENAKVYNGNKIT